MMAPRSSLGSCQGFWDDRDHPKVRDGVHSSRDGYGIVAEGAPGKGATRQPNRSMNVAAICIRARLGPRMMPRRGRPERETGSDRRHRKCLKKVYVDHGFDSHGTGESRTRASFMNKHRVLIVEDHD